MAEMIRVLVSGAAGRMGSTVVEAVEAADGMEVAAKADPALGVTVEECLPGADVMVEFSTPESAAQNVRQALDVGVHAVVGATGFDLEALRADVLSSDTDARCFVAPNFAIGAVLMMRFAAQAAE